MTVIHYFMKTQQSKRMTIRELPYLGRTLPASWKKAAGLLRHKRKELEQHLKQVHNEWNDAK